MKVQSRPIRLFLIGAAALIASVWLEAQAYNGGGYYNLGWFIFVSWVATLGGLAAIGIVVCRKSLTSKRLPVIEVVLSAGLCVGVEVAWRFGSAQDEGLLGKEIWSWLALATPVVAVAMWTIAIVLMRLPNAD